MGNNNSAKLTGKPQNTEILKNVKINGLKMFKEPTTCIRYRHSKALKC
jgi:hypothetical protein